MSNSANSAPSLGWDIGGISSIGESYHRMTKGINNPARFVNRPTRQAASAEPDKSTGGKSKNLASRATSNPDRCMKSHEKHRRDRAALPRRKPRIEDISAGLHSWSKLGQLCPLQDSRDRGSRSGPNDRPFGSGISPPHAGSRV